MTTGRGVSSEATAATDSRMRERSCFMVVVVDAGWELEVVWDKSWGWS